MERKDFDVIVVGAGPAGAMCALSAARSGLNVLLLEAAGKRDHGHTHVLEVEKDVFERCGLPEPEGDEIAYLPKGLRAFSFSGWEAFHVDEHRMHILNLRETVRRITGYAADAGVDVRFNRRVRHVLVEGNRVVGVVVNGSRGTEQTYFGETVIDATGYAAALVRRLPSSCGIDFTDQQDDRILAEVRTFKIDRDAAAAQAAAGDFVPEVLHHTIGRYGSFSTLSFTISLDFEIAWLLAGILDANMPPTPAEALDDLAKRFPFIKEEVNRGASPIRIRRAGFRLVTDGFAVVGEAAGMVIPLQASGVTSSLLAGDSLGRHLGRVLQDGGRATTETLWPWAAAYQRGRGAVLASYDANRRLLRTLDPHTEIEPLFKSGLSQPEDMYRAFAAQPLRVSAETLPARLSAIARNPLLAGKVIPALAKSPVVELHWRRYPETWDRDTFGSWKKIAKTLLP